MKPNKLSIVLRHLLNNFYVSIEDSKIFRYLKLRSFLTLDKTG